MLLKTLDVSSSESRTEFVNWFKNNYKSFDILVNNAGILMRGSDWDDLMHSSENYQPTEKVA